MTVLLSRRKALQAGIGLAAGLAASRSTAWADEPIKVGLVEDLSGEFQVEGVSKAHCTQLAVDEINASGGLLGRQLQLIVYDSQSDNKLYAQYAQQLALRDRVAVVHGALLSASKEVIRPILGRAKTLYFYNTEYEGGVCDKNCFCPGPVAPQELNILLNYAFQKSGKRIYIVGADYNYGRLSAAASVSVSRALGGEVIGQDFYPLDATDFSATISRIQQEKPDAIHSILIGTQKAFYGQWKAAGMAGNIPILGQAFGNAGELTSLPHDVTNGIVVAKNYFDNIDTPANAAFRKALFAKFAPNEYISPNGLVSYEGLHLWALAVKRAGTIERDAVIAALESGVTFDGPSGAVRIDGKTHHTYRNIYLAVAKDGKYEIEQTSEAVAPVVNDDRCNLVENPSTNTVFVAQ